MGYAFIMFGVLLITSVLIVTAVTYGIAKDSQIAPLKAENIYAERETGKAQTGLIINNTCLSQSGRYLEGQGGWQYGPHNLYLTVKNNGSIVLNPNRATVLYNTSYINFTVTNTQDEPDEVCEEDSQNVTVWAPLTYACMKASNIFINPGSPAEGPELRLLVAAENGVSVIAPTTPLNFTGGTDKSNSSFIFDWKASADDKGVDYYLLYQFDRSPDLTCPIKNAQIVKIPGNQTGGVFSSTIFCQPCRNTWFFVVAVDVEGNMGIPSRTLKCPPGAGVSCDY